MQETGQKILKLLKTNGGLTTNELSARVGVSATAVRKHLKTLEAQDVVCHEIVPSRMGRPSFVYRLTSHLPTVFRRNHNVFAASIIQELTKLKTESHLEELVRRHMQKRHQKYVDRIKGATLDARVACLARLMEYEGRMTTWQQLSDDGFILRMHNCPFRYLPRELDHPCRLERVFLEQVLQARVTRVNHILEGDICCVYQIQAGDDEGVGPPRALAPSRRGSRSRR